MAGRGAAGVMDGAGKGRAPDVDGRGMAPGGLAAGTRVFLSKAGGVRRWSLDFDGTLIDAAGKAAVGCGLTLDGLLEAERRFGCADGAGTVGIALSAFLAQIPLSAHERLEALSGGRLGPSTAVRSVLFLAAGQSALKDLAEACLWSLAAGGAHAVLSDA